MGGQNGREWGWHAIIPVGILLINIPKDTARNTMQQSVCDQSAIKKDSN